MKINHASLTHVGRIRQHNEDRMAQDPGAGLFVVADGMGGHEHGEVAAQVGVDAILLACNDGQDLGEAVMSAHRAVCAHPAHTGGSSGMGATVVAVKINDKGQWDCAWVGDSRAYWLERTHAGSRMHQVSHDHTPVQALVDAGLIDRAQAMRHSERHLIDQALGVPLPRRGDIVVGQSQGDLHAGERLLLCSDGLNTVVDDATIHSLLSAPIGLDAVAQSLVEAALDAGGPDNITVAVIEAA